MAQRRTRRLGAVTALVGLTLTVVGVVASVAPAGAATTEGLVCNNQQNRPDKDCVGDKNHGTIESSFDTNGNLVFELEAADSFSGWRQIYICVGTGDTPTNSADCQGNTPTLLHPDAAGGDEYNVTDVVPDSTITENAKDVSFGECATGITAVVAAAALPPGEFNWIVHVNSCEGTTDEAFGTATRGTTNEVSYACAAPTGVSADAATLRGSTTNTDVDEATFHFTSPADEVRSFQGVAGADGSWSAAVTGLQPDTAYTYDVAFFAGGEEATGTAEDCAFATTRGPDRYTCEAPTNVTADSATLRGSTTDESIDAARFRLTGPSTSTTLTGAETGDSNRWTANATGLAPGTRYTYAVDFVDDGTLHGTGADASCAFTTSPVLTRSTIVVTEDITQVAGVVLTAPTPDTPVAAVAAVVAPAPQAAPKVAAAPLARTGLATDLLLPLGFGLLLFGVVALLLGRRQELVLVRRPAGQHYR